MYALTMYEEYLEDILTGKRTYDARTYANKRRGRIGIVKSKTNLLYGYVDFVDCKQIPFEEFVYWHICPTYTVAQAEADIEYNNTRKNKKTNHGYAYVFKNPVLLDSPIEIKPIKKNGSWIEFDEEDSQRSYIQTKLF